MKIRESRGIRKWKVGFGGKGEGGEQIIRDLKEKHRKDSTSAPEVSVVQQMKKDLDEVANFKGSKLENRSSSIASSFRLITENLRRRSSSGLFGFSGSQSCIEAIGTDDKNLYFLKDLN